MILYQGPVSGKSRKASRKTVILFEMKALRRLHFEDTKKIMSAEMRPKSLRALEKRAPGLLGPVDVREINRL